MGEVADRIEIKIVAAEDLPFVSGMKPSPFAEVTVGQDVNRTDPVIEEENPRWGGSAMIFSGLLMNDTESVMVYIKHKDTSTGKETPLGVTIIPLSTAYNSPRMEIDAWYPLNETTGVDEAQGEVRVKMIYFNKSDADMQASMATDAAVQPPNLLEVHISDARGLGDGKAMEAFVIVQVGDLRKESRICKKSSTPSWDEIITIPIMDGKEMVDITVKQSTLVRNIFLGRLRLSMTEIAAAGESGVRKSYSLLNENLQFDPNDTGKLQVGMRWIFDQATDDENKRIKINPMGILSKMARLIMGKKPETSADSKEEEKKEEAKKEEKEQLPAGMTEEMLDMSPYELEQYFKEQAKKRQEEMENILQIPTEELELPEGDYSIQVSVIEVTGIKGSHASGMSDPFAVVEVLGQKQKTRYMKEVSSAFFNETFYFNFKDLKKEEIAEASVKITVYDHYWLRSHETIGVYQVDLISVYNCPDHEIYRKWGSLRNPLNEDDSGVQGLVKFSVFCLGPGDRQKAHDPALEDDEEEDMDTTEGAKSPDAGDGVKQSLQFLVLSVLRAEGLPGFTKVFTGSGLYAFLTIEFAGCKPMKTSKVSVIGRKNLSVSFEEEIWIPVWVPSMSKRAAVTIINREFGRRDQIIARAYLDFDIIPKFEYDPVQSGALSFIGLAKKKYQGPNFEWIHLYGANPLVRTGPKQAQFMNRFPNYGSAYRGSILASMRVVKHSNGIDNAHKKPMNYEIPEPLIPKGANYLLRLMIYQGSDFGSTGQQATGKGAQYAIGVGVGPHELRSNFRQYENGAVDWLELSEQTNIPLPEDLKLLPDTFITLYKGSEDSHTPVAFCRLKTVSILPSGLASPPNWYELQHDQSHKSTATSGYPGSVLMKISLMNMNDIFEPVDWEPERKKMLTKTPSCLRVFIYQCRGLPSVDDNGLIDPYVKIRFAGSKKKTVTRKQTQNPTFFECLEFSQMLPTDSKLAPVILLQVWDQKALGRLPVCALRMAVADVPIAYSQISPPPPPEWRELKGIDGAAKMGEILVSFQLLPKKSIEQPLVAPKDITPSFKKVWLDIHVVGARSLVGSKRRPFLKFDLVSHSYGDMVQTPASRNPNAINPNFLDRYIMMTQMPEDPQMSPTLEVRCYDQRMSGNVLLGSANIDLRTKMPWNGDEYIPPRQHKIMEDNVKAKQAIVDAKLKGQKKKSQTDEDADGEAVVAEEVKIDDIGIGVFPPEPGATEPGAKYLELPSIMDQEEIEKMREQNKLNDKLGLSINADMASMDKGGKSSAWKKVIGFPSTWVSTEYLKDREWWIQSKKKGEGGQLEDFLKFYAFENYEFYRGHIKFNKFGKRRDTVRKIGTLKAVIRVCTKNPRSDEEYNKFAKMIRQVTKCVVRVYITKAQNLMPMDFFGSASPYLKASLGDKEKKDMKSLNRSTLNPDFFSFFEFPTSLPGPSLLKIQVWDHSRLSTSDKLMGETIIDLEDRWFHPKWTEFDEKKPLENRTLTKIGSATGQGAITMWVDILTAQEALKTPPVEIVGPEKKEFEIRIVCWRCIDVPAMDGGVSDLFVSFFMEGTDRKLSTDTHWRAKGGRASWNYRIKLPIELPIKEREYGRLRVQLWERNIFTSNEIVGENSINLYDWLMLAYKRVVAPIYPFKEKRDAIAKLGSFGFGGFDGGDDEEEEDEPEEDEEIQEAIPGEEEEPEEDDDDEKPLLEKKEDKKVEAVVEEEDDDEPKKKKKDDKEDEADEDESQALIKMFNSYFESGRIIADDGEWIEMMHHDRKKGKLLKRGEVAVTVHIVPESEFKAQPVGSGRDEPNQNPFLMYPSGRMMFSFNPCTLIYNILGPRVICCLCCCCCCICCILLFVVLSTYLSGIMSIYDMIIAFTPSDEPTMQPTFEPTHKPTS